MGVVYEVEDRVRGEIVALKTLRRTSAANVYRLKQEFRSLADVTHRNLVCLYELLVEDDRCFFTMELVRGVSFVEYVRDADAGAVSRDRLVHALRQLAAGVSALHRAGKLHRDIKPSNVLVTPDGRVVILDFGMIAEAAAPAGEGRHLRGGTPAYMSPEEAAGGSPSAASDWYSVGVSVYEALTSRVPFDEYGSEMLTRKGTSDPVPPADIAPMDAPPDLSDICMRLMERLPERRMNGSALLAALGGDAAHESAGQASTAQDALFVGRRREQIQAQRP
jgi:serine/threonine protein kinase